MVESAAAEARLRHTTGASPSQSGGVLGPVGSTLVGNQLEADRISSKLLSGGTVLGQVIERSRLSPGGGMGATGGEGRLGLDSRPCADEPDADDWPLPAGPSLQTEDFAPGGSRHPTGQVAPESLLRSPHAGTLGQLAAGGIAGAVSKSCTAPLARLTILLQVQGMHDNDGGRLARQRHGVWQEAARIAREEGLRAFWKGNMVTIVHRLPYSSINFFAYEKYKMLIWEHLNTAEGDRGMSLGMATRLVAGGSAGITAATMTYPLDLVRTRLAAQTKEVYYKGIWGTLTKIARDEGPRGLYKGMGATLMGVGPSIAINFCAYETLKIHWLMNWPDTPPVMVSLGCGSVAGICSSTATFPLDLVRRRMQLEGAAGRARVYNAGIFSTFRQILRTDGFFGFYRGIIPEYYKVVPGVSIAFMTYEFMKKLLQPYPD